MCDTQLLIARFKSIISPSLKPHLLQISAVDLRKGMCSSNSALTKMGLDGGWQIVYQAKPLDIHFGALNVSRQYQRS